MHTHTLTTWNINRHHFGEAQQGRDSLIERDLDNLGRGGDRMGRPEGRAGVNVRGSLG